MGYRISLSNINSIGHLIEGNVISFLNQTYLDDNYYEGNINYIDDLVSENNFDFISSNQRRFELRRSYFRKEWLSIKELMNDLYYNNQELNCLLQINYPKEILFFFKELSNLLGGYKHRYMLLPGFENTNINQLMVRREDLKQLLRIEASSSYLIIQLKEIPEKNNIQILDSFKHMNNAIERIDEWPAVLVWERYGWGQTRGIFIPISNFEEIRSIIEAQNFEKQYFNYLQKTYGFRRTKRFAQLIHLSDLHLGVNGEEIKHTRLIEILKKHRRNTDSQVQMYPIITGDIVDTPSQKNVRLYESFASQLDSIGLQNLITVLGNHDVHIKGFLRSNQQSKNTLTSLASGESVTILDNLKLILIRFNSNTDGKWAQGKIGSEQLSDIGNRLDRIKGKDDYYKIAILHHHPFEMEQPQWMRKTWYESLLGQLRFDVENSNILIDAELFVEWLNNREISFIMHGHKHIPKLFTKKGINMVAAGSSTGNVDHSNSDKTFLTYNIINYDLELNKPISSTIVFEDLIGSGTKNYQVEKY